MKKQLSIKALLQRISWLMLILSIVPLIISVLIYTRYLFTYERSISNISEANRIANDVEENIMEEAWSLTYGQTKPSEFTESNSVRRVKKEIRQIKENTQSAQERATLNIVIRSLDNVNSFLEKSLEMSSRMHHLMKIKN